MMGSGKTSIGRRLARRSRRPFVDMDEAYIGRWGETVATTFANDGEAAFRRREAELLATLLNVDEPLVIAAGGGVVVTAESRALLAGPHCCCVYLDASLPFLVAKAEARPHRPLLQGTDPAVVLGDLLATREGWYREIADLAWPVEGRKSKAAAARALSSDLGLDPPQW